MLIDLSGIKQIAIFLLPISCNKFIRNVSLFDSNAAEMGTINVRLAIYGRDIE